MLQTKTAPYGSWKSPITSDLIVAQITMLSDVRLAEDGIYWLEGRPQERGRNVIVRAGSDGTPTDITPTDFNARTRVHEYGGASWLVAGGPASSLILLISACTVSASASLTPSL